MSKATQMMSDLDRYLAEHPEDAEALAKREPLIQIASALIELRAALNMKQDEFAKLAGLLPSQLSEYEHAATSGITLQTLCRIAKGAGAGLRIYFNMRVDNCDSGRLFAGVVTPVQQSSETTYVVKEATTPMALEGIAA